MKELTMESDYVTQLGEGLNFTKTRNIGGSQDILTVFKEKENPNQTGPVYGSISYGVLFDVFYVILIFLNRVCCQFRYKLHMKNVRVISRCKLLKTFRSQNFLVLLSI